MLSPFKSAAAALLIALSTASSGLAQVFWSSQSTPAITDDIWDVTFANGIFAAVTAQGNVLTSSDGVTWTNHPALTGTWLVSITYGNGVWVAVGAGGTILLSHDLNVWMPQKSATTNKLNGVLFTGYIFVAVGDGGTILSSLDAQTWLSQASGVTGFLHGITYAPDVNLGPIVPARDDVIVSGEGGIVLYAPAGEPFESLPLTATLNFFSEPSGTTQNLEAILVSQTNQGGFRGAVAAGANGTLLYSQNLPPFTFQAGSAPATTATFRGLTSGNGTYVAAGDQGTIMTSPDGITWTQRFAGDSYATLSTATLLGAAYSPSLNRFVIVGTGGTILTSSPPPSVFANVSTRGLVRSTQSFIGGFVIEGSAARTVLIRADGPVLGSFNVPNPLPDPVLTVYDQNQNVVARNAGWGTNTSPSAISSAALMTGAFALPSSSLDSVLLLTLSPGAYTAIITSAGGNSGSALFEAYTY